MACSAQLQKAENDSTVISRQDLFRVARQQPVLIVYGSRQEAYAASYRKISEQMAANPGRREIMIKADSVVTPDLLTQNVIFLVGTPQSNHILKNLIEKLPLTFHNNSFTFADKTYADSADVIALPFYPNPLNPAMPMSLLTGNDDAALLDLYHRGMETSLWNRWGYTIYHEQQRQVMGEFSDNLWQIDKVVHYDFSDSEQKIRETPHFQFITHQLQLSEKEADQIVANREMVYTEIAAFTGAPLKQKISYHLYPSSEIKGLMINNTDQGNVDMDNNAVHTIWNEEFAGNHIAMETELLVRQALGKPALDVMEKGLAVSFTDAWQKQGYVYWAVRLFQSSNLPSLTDLFNNELFGKESYLVNYCAAGTFVDFLVAKWGKDAFLKNYLSWQPTANEIPALEKEWHAYMTALAEDSDIDINKDRTQPLAFYKGFNFTQEGFQIYDGYNSQKATESLEKIHELGGNAVTIVPYGFMSSAHEPSFLNINRSAHGENDEGVIHSAFSARQLGMQTMLKPQIWVRGAWPGEIAMQNEADWNRFFEYYYRWIRHYALLAEMRQIDIFCIGVELSQVTLTHEPEFRKLIQKIRKMYTGKLVYAPNWGPEFESISLWNDLDYIAINCYYPLSSEEDPSDRQLINNFEKTLSKIEKVVNRYKKPVLITEIGFRSIEAPWMAPHAEAGEAASNVESQARGYQTVFKCLQDKSWCRGIFWWQWPSALEESHPGDRSFHPTGKATEKVIANWFHQLP